MSLYPSTVTLNMSGSKANRFKLACTKNEARTEKFNLVARKAVRMERGRADKTNLLAVMRILKLSFSGNLHTERNGIFLQIQPPMAGILPASRRCACNKGETLLTSTFFIANIQI